jgi:simple sugar transport system permease protein
MTTQNTNVVTLETLRTITTKRSFGYGLTLVIIGLMEVLWFGGASSKLETTIEFGFNSATAMPTLSGAASVVLLLLGALTIGVVSIPMLRQRVRASTWSKGVRRFVVTLGGLLVAWPVLLWLGVNQDGNLRTLTLPVALSGYVVGAASIGVGAYIAWKRVDKGASLSMYIGLVTLMLTFLLWVARGSNVSGLDLQLTSLLALAVASATFLIFGSLSGTICERAGIVNIAIEGQFMAGAISSVLLASALRGTGVSLVLAVVLAGLFGAFFGWVLAVMALRYKADQIIVGVVIVAFCTALTQFITTQVLDNQQNLNQSFALPTWAIPGLSRIPVVGPILFDQSVLVYVAILAIVFAHVALFRTRWGLRVRSVGEKPIASETVGVNVVRYRYGAVLLGGFIAGVGGAAFTLGPGSNFTYGMTNGYGYVALAIMIFGRWRPYGAMMASLLFGFTIAMSANMNLYLSQLVIPQQLISALPYIITIAAVAGLVGQIRPPAADGVPFSRE